MRGVGGGGGSYGLKWQKEGGDNLSLESATHKIFPVMQDSESTFPLEKQEY